MKRLVLALLTLSASSSAWGSGCGSYDNFREILETIEDNAPGRLMFRLIDSSPSTARIHMGASEMTLEFIYETSFKPDDQGYAARVNVRDIKFTEGNGCGPVYDCITGQYILTIPDPAKNTARVYVYPRVTEFREYANGTVVWLAPSVLPTLLGMTIQGDPSDQKQCVWGFW